MIDINEIKSIKSSGYGYHFPTIDFKFRNTGTATAFLRRFAVEIVRAEVDPSPVIELTASAHEVLVITGENRGWGDAKELSITLANDNLTRLFTPDKLRSQHAIRSGEKKTLLSLTRQDADLKQWERLLGELRHTERLVATNDRWEEFRRLRRQREDAAKCSIGSLRAKWTCIDEKGIAHNEEGDVGGYWSYITLGHAGFQEVDIPDSVYSMAHSDVTYITIIDAQRGPHRREYPISRKVPPGDVERFHIMLGSPMSCQLDLRFHFLVDERTNLSSDYFRVDIWNPRDTWWKDYYKDGDEVERASLQSNRHGRTAEPFLETDADGNPRRLWF